MHFGFAQCKQKGFAPVLILVGILVLGMVAGGAYYFGKSQVSKPQPQNPVIASQIPQPVSSPSASPDETASWKTYTNNNFTFSIKYPVGILPYTENRIDTKDNLFLRLSDLNSERQASVNFYIQVYKNNDSLEKYDEKQFESSSDKNSLLVGGDKGFLYYHDPIAPNGLPEVPVVFSYDFFIKHAGAFYQISLNTERGEDFLKMKRDLFNQILSTFRFTQ